MKRDIKHLYKHLYKCFISFFEKVRKGHFETEIIVTIVQKNKINYR